MSSRDMMKASRPVTVLDRLYTHRCSLAWITSGALLVIYTVLVSKLLGYGVLASGDGGSLGSLPGTVSLVLLLSFLGLMIFRYAGDTTTEAMDNAG